MGSSRKQRMASMKIVGHLLISLSDFASGEAVKYSVVSADLRPGEWSKDIGREIIWGWSLKNLYASAGLQFRMLVDHAV
jgi:hypothetical protein